MLTLRFITWCHITVPNRYAKPLCQTTVSNHCVTSLCHIMMSLSYSLLDGTPMVLLPASKTLLAPCFITDDGD